MMEASDEPAVRNILENTWEYLKKQWRLRNLQNKHNDYMQYDIVIVFKNTRRTFVEKLMKIKEKICNFTVTQQC